MNIFSELIERMNDTKNIQYFIRAISDNGNENNLKTSSKEIHFLFHLSSISYTEKNIIVVK
jgi:hypothetical protein